MPLPTNPERAGSLSALGVAREATFGTFLAPTNWSPFKSCTLVPDTGLFFPPVMTGLRDKNVYAAYGQYKYLGAVGATLFPSMGIPYIVAAIGGDGGRSGQTLGNGVTSVSTGSGTTLNGGVSAGATTITLTAASGFANGQILQIDVNSAGVTSSECRKIQSGGGTTSITLDSALSFAHLTGVTVLPATNPSGQSVPMFSHSILQANVLDSLSIEKVVGGFQSELYVGCRVNKYNLKLAATDTEAEFTADIIGKSASSQSSPDTVSILNEAPFVFAECTFTLFGTAIQVPTTIELDIDNTVKSTYSMTGAHDPAYITAMARAISGKLTPVFTSVSGDATYSYFTNYYTNSPMTGSLSIALAHPSNGGSITITLPAVNFKKFGDEIKLEDVVLTPLEYDAKANLASSPITTISATIVDSAYLPW
jgi:hypothetical protein